MNRTNMNDMQPITTISDDRPLSIEEDLLYRKKRKMGMLKYDLLTYKELLSVITASAKRLGHSKDTILGYNIIETPRIAKRAGIIKISKTVKQFRYKGEIQRLNVYTVREHEYWSTQSNSTIAAYFDKKYEQISREKQMKKQVH